MGEFNLTLSGKADRESVREAFENAVKSIRDAADEAFDLTGSLTVDGEEVTTADDVPEAEDTEEGAAPV